MHVNYQHDYYYRHGLVRNRIFIKNGLKHSNNISGWELDGLKIKTVKYI